MEEQTLKEIKIQRDRYFKEMQNLVKEIKIMTNNLENLINDCDYISDVIDENIKEESVK